jgi:hypothetical protein
MSASISEARLRRPNSTVADIRESVENGPTMSGARGGFSAARASQPKPRQPSAATAAQADRNFGDGPRRKGEVAIEVTTEFVVCFEIDVTSDRRAFRAQISLQYADIAVAYGSPGLANLFKSYQWLTGGCGDWALASMTVRNRLGGMEELAVEGEQRTICCRHYRPSMPMKRVARYSARPESLPHRAGGIHTPPRTARKVTQDFQVPLGRRP